MENQKNQYLEDLLTDDSFCQWLKGRANASDNTYWDKWLAFDTKHEGLVRQAKTIVLAFEKTETHLTKEEIDAESARILHTISAMEEPKRGRLMPYWWIAAASIALVAVVGFWIFGKNKSTTPPSVSDANLMQIIDIQSIKNDTTVRFTDGSTVQLKKGASLQYTKNFTDTQRAVTLINGEAYFEVKKNREKPFVVFANDIVTKVLGTSFIVKTSNTEGGTSSVVVRSGKVAVFKKSDFIKPASEAKDSVLLTPNQQVSRQTNTMPLITSIVEKPILIEKPLGNPNFVFDNAPISDIFNTLEKAYQVKIIADDTILNTCRISISLGMQDTLFDKIKVVCKVIGAQYKVAQTTIIISGKGC